MKHVTPKTFIKQLIIKDIFGKDSQRGVSLTYAWLANQLGHFSLGFFPSIALSILLKTYKTPKEFSVYVILFWTFFEVLNLTIPIFVKNKTRAFKPQWKHLIFDTLTDILYFTLGAMVSLYLLTKDAIAGSLVILLLLILLYPFIYWYTLRIYQQYAYFPFQFRISQWMGSINDSEKNIIEDYIKNTESKDKKHLLIFGNVNEGKTNLGVAIANELAIKKQSCTYTTATKLYSLFFKTTDNKDWLWNWKNCDYLVIDDINPDNLKHNKLLTPDDFLKYLDQFTLINTLNRTVIKNKNVIWVLGTNEKTQREQWCKLLQTIGVTEKNIYCVNLSD